MRFTKMHGIGNDYVYLDAVAEPALAGRDDLPQLARAISDRNTGVGGDGLIIVSRPDHGVEADVAMRMFNADGSEAEMCGNGVRCVCKLAHDRGHAHTRPMRIQTGRGVLSLDYTVDEAGLVDFVTVDMGEPILQPDEIPVALPGSSGRPHIVDQSLAEFLSFDASTAWVEAAGLDLRATCVSMGNPHAVLYCDDVEAIPLEAIGPIFETLSIHSNRANTHFVQVGAPEEVIMRTWERGSGATLACGTGAAAVCVAGVLTGRTARRILAHLPGGDLELYWDEATNHVFMKGAAAEVFTGEWPH